MRFTWNRLGIYIRLCLAVSVLLLPACPLHAENLEELRVLGIFYRDSELVSTPSRYPKPVSRVAENITIVTSGEIKAINAHTLSDVLLHVTGVQTALFGSPGSIGNVQIQGSESRQVLVTIDGVVQNNLSDGVADLGAIPVQNIDRIEIVKGPASSSWGSSLGGIINIITKSPVDRREFGGTASASAGSRGTGDYRAELSGKTADSGYYLEGGGLVTDGLLPHNSMHGGNLYSKFSWSPTDRSGLLFSLGYANGKRGVTQSRDPVSFYDNDFEYLFSNLSFSHSFNDELSADASLRFMHRDIRLTQDTPDFESRVDLTDKELNWGGGLKLAWDHGFSQFVAGTDFDIGRLDSVNEAVSGGQEMTVPVRADLNRFAFYANDTFGFGSFSVIPGIRYDYTSTNGDFVSPSLGFSYAVTGDTIMRVYMARGFNIPPLSDTSGTGFFSRPNPDLKMEKVLSWSAGFETAELKYLWLKTTFFRHYVDDALKAKALSDNPPAFMIVNGGKELRQGVEVEVRTIPVLNTSLVAGYAFIDASDRETGDRIPDVAKYTVDVGLQYADKKYFSGNVKGHLIRWNSVPQENGRDSAMIWDINLSRTLFDHEKKAVEIFFTAHNIFNGSQYPLDLYKNPRRWFEGGLRVGF